MEKCISIAIENGWKNNHGIHMDFGKPKFVVYGDSKIYGISYIRWNTFPNQPLDGELIRWSDTLLDPLFWQALGKGLGWNGKNMDACCESNPGSQDEWFYNWHNFIDHLASGKSVDSFFEELLNNK